MTSEVQERVEEQVVSGPTHPPVAEKVACVDFDGTIAPWGAMFSFPEPLPGVVESINRLKAAGYTVVIFTSRLSQTWHEAEGWDHHTATEEQVKYLRDYCEKYGIDADAATAEKIPAEVYLDDKALQVDASHSILSQVETFLSEGLFWLKPSNSRRGSRWHRVKGKPVRTATKGWNGQMYYRWVGEAVCGQNLYGLNGEKYEDLFVQQRYGSRLSNKRDTEQGYCLHCVRADKKRERESNAAA